MLKSISWQSFLILTTFLLITWYVLIGIRYYSKDIRRIIFSKRKINSDHPNGSGAQEPSANAMDLFDSALRLRNDIRQILATAARKQFPKEELVMAIQIMLREYPQLHHTAFQVAINHYIEQESENKCSTLFGEDDLRIIWMS